MKKLPGYVSVLALIQLAACSNDPAAVRNDVPTEQATASANGAAAAQAQDERLILAFGDSLYAGYGLDPGQSFPAMLERELEERGVAARVVNAGVSGDTSAAGLNRLAFTLDGLGRAPDLAIVGLGANDMLRGLNPAETRRNLDAIMAELKRRGVPIMITGMLAPRNLDRTYIDQFEAIYPALAEKYDAQLDPFFLDGVITRPELLLPDGIHPNAAGIARIADRLAPTVAGELEQAPAGGGN